MKQVMLRVSVEHDDGVFTVEREAPELPAGVTWHAGMRLCGDAVGYMYVKGVEVDWKGNAYVHFEKRCDSQNCNDIKAWFTQHGWKSCYADDERTDT